jgi:hypothetical protein
MSHQHFCDFAGHYWECDGTAVRLFAPEASVCMCLDHGVPMEEGDHSTCSVELLSCLEHRADQMRAMGYDPSYTIEPSPESDQSSMFTDSEGNHTVGFCLWCGRDFYCMEEVENHNANDMAGCAEFQRCKDTVRMSTPNGRICMPPALQTLFDEADLADCEDTE